MRALDAILDKGRVGTGVHLDKGFGEGLHKHNNVSTLSWDKTTKQSPQAQESNSR